MPRPTTTAALPGPCVEIPQASWVWTVTSQGVDQEGEFHSSTRDHGLSTHRGLDLDVDGIGDAAVPVIDHGSTAADCPEDVAWDLYVVRGDCGHLVGRVVGRQFALDQWRAPVGPGGLQSVTTLTETTARTDPPRGVPIHTTVRRTHHFTGSTYIAGDTTRRDGRCHHCSTWTCAGPRPRN